MAEAKVTVEEETGKRRLVVVVVGVKVSGGMQPAGRSWDEGAVEFCLGIRACCTGSSTPLPCRRSHQWCRQSLRKLEGCLGYIECWVTGEYFPRCRRKSESLQEVQIVHPWRSACLQLVRKSAIDHWETGMKNLKFSKRSGRNTW